MTEQSNRLAGRSSGTRYAGGIRRRTAKRGNDNERYQPPWRDCHGDGRRGRGRRVHAQGAWKPSRPLTIYNPLAAGGVCDVHLRFLAERMTKIWGTQVNVDVKAGAGATLAAAQMVNVKPDGQIIACMTINSLRYPHY